MRVPALPLTTRRCVAAALAAGLVLAVPAAASAHVTVRADDAQKGGYTKLVFRVPNESDTARTTKLVITLPTATPIASIRTRPKPGWTATIVTKKLATPVDTGEAKLTEAPATVTFTAAPGSALRPGQFDEFELSGGPLPDSVDELSFPAAQYYSDGTVVNWNQPTVGDKEPAHPAPVLALTAATGDGHGHGGDAAAAGESEEAGDGVALGLGIAALVVSLLAAGLGFVAFRRSGRPAGTAGA